MHAMAGELDMRKMSGLKSVLPKTRWLLLIGALALAATPPFSGFWSKDEIVVAAGYKSLLLNAVLLLTSLMTAYYTFRLYFRVFEGPLVLPESVTSGGHGHGSHDSHGTHGSRDSHDSHGSRDSHDDHAHGAAHGHDSGHAHGHGDHAHHNHEPAVMILPLVVLAIGAIVAGGFNLPLGGETVSHALGHFLGNSPSLQMSYQTVVASFPGAKVDPVPFGLPGEAHPHWIPMIVGTVVSLAGIFLAFVLHLRSREQADQLATRLAPVARAIENKYWVDELYDAVIVRPLRLVGQAFFAADRFIVDGLVGVVGFVPQLSGFVLKLSTQRGYLQGYAVTMLLGVALVLLLVFL
jgi:NADH-quinone oxidoreductase subunit L